MCVGATQFCAGLLVVLYSVLLLIDSSAEAARDDAARDTNLADPQLRAACRAVLLAAFSDEPGFRWVVGDGDYAGYVRLQGTPFLPGQVTLARCEKCRALVPGIRIRG